jgi:hypothetical protein
MFNTDYEPESIAPKVTLDKNPAGLQRAVGAARRSTYFRETGVPLTAPELARLVLERMGKEPTERAIAMLGQDNPQQLLSATEPRCDL